MTTMLEKAARAAYDGHDFKPRDDMGGDLRFDDLATFYQEYWRNSARAVLMAVREPSDGVEDAGEAGYRDNAPDEHSRISPYAIGKSFTAMIDHILNEPTNPE